MIWGFQNHMEANGDRGFRRLLKGSSNAYNKRRKPCASKTDKGIN